MVGAVPGRIRREVLAAASLAALAASACSVSHSMRPLDVADPAIQGGGGSDEYPCEARSARDGAAVRWFGPDRDGDRLTLAAWCSAVGPVELRPEPSRDVPPPASDSTLTVVTWNAHVGGGDVAAFLSSELGYSCEGDAHDFPEHFVLLVQEAFRASDAVPEAPEGALVAGRIEAAPQNGPRLDIVQVADMCGLALFYVPSMRNGADASEAGREDRGSAILSTLPLSEPVAIELPLEAQRRVTAVVDVSFLGGPSLRVASVHFDVAGNVLRVLGTGGSMRVRQNDGQTEALDYLDVEETKPIVVAGDLNTWSSRETVILRMSETYPDSPDPGREKTRGGWPPDHLFFRAGDGPFELVEGSYLVVGDDHGSDHMARRARLAVR